MVVVVVVAVVVVAVALQLVIGRLHLHLRLELLRHTARPPGKQRRGPLGMPVLELTARPSSKPAACTRARSSALSLSLCSAQSSVACLG